MTTRYRHPHDLIRDQWARTQASIDSYWIFPESTCRGCPADVTPPATHCDHCRCRNAMQRATRQALKEAS